MHALSQDTTRAAIPKATSAALGLLLRNVNSGTSATGAETLALEPYKLSPNKPLGCKLNFKKHNQWMYTPKTISEPRMRRHKLQDTNTKSLEQDRSYRRHITSGHLQSACYCTTCFAFVHV